MLEMLLIVELKAGQDENGPLRARRHIKLDALPAVGHEILVNQSLLNVDRVRHDADVTEREEVTTEVVCKVTSEMMNHLVYKCEWREG